ncbi:MAG: tetratricopeptide repeat protein [Acidobacteria bacterium]|nr:tetratricopeptide repeat protein [Acidobacteriota bacterium]
MRFLLLLATAAAAQTPPDGAKLLRAGKTAEARALLERYVGERPGDAEGWFQLARTHLAEFHLTGSRVVVDLAIESLAAALKRNPDHVYALKAKSVLHARAELLHYDPN